MNLMFTKLRAPLILPLLLFMLANGCATTETGTQQETPAPPSSQAKEDTTRLLTNLDRPVPNPITDEIPPGFYQAVENDTRTLSGKPGSDYWQQRSDYDIEVEILPQEKKLKGKSTITYHNNSPDTLRQILLELSQNLHKEGVARKGQTEITGGVNLTSVMYEGQSMDEITARGQNGYSVMGTLMSVLPPKPIMPGETVTMQTEWNFTIPQRGASGRMGYNEDNLIFIAYWYPKIQVYDEVIGWFTDPFLGNAEFYNEFGNFDVDITAPAQWIVAATGNLTNADQVLLQPIYERLQKAHRSDSVMAVVTEEDFGNVTTSGENGKVTWNFAAEKVNDFAFSLTKESNWDAARTPVGDLDGDGSTDYSHVNAFYRDSAPLWQETARYEQHSLKFLSDFTDLSYPWPHMTAVEGGGIIGGGMEFPMMTIMGSYRGQSPQSLYAVTAHELAHMWIPMQIATNERRYAWIDEGTTTFNENQAKNAYFDDIQAHLNDFQSYLGIVNTGLEGPIMRRSDYQYTGYAYGTASYSKPASVIVALRGLLGKETFTKAYHAFMERWQYKHPYPWDFFNIFEDISGRELDWFWRSWYYETWELDQGVANVTETEQGTRIVIEDYGQIPMPAEVKITLANGDTITRNIEVETWLRGATTAVLTVDTDSEVTRIVIDPEHKFPDVNRSNNIWKN